jgi:hypothetical protein
MSVRKVLTVLGLRRYETFAEWVAENPAPDLQALVARFDGYSRVPPEAWMEFDNAMRKWQEEYRKRHLDEK